MKYISLHPSRSRPTAYYVRVPRSDGTRISKLFSFCADDKDGVLVDAKLWRSRMLFELWGERGLLDKKRIVSPGASRKGRVYRTGKPNRSSRHLGVSHNAKPLKNGGLACRWVAIWREDGRVRTKSFGYGGEIGAARERSSDEAMRLAIDYRKKMVDMYYMKDVN